MYDLLTPEEIAELFEPIAAKSQTITLFGVANTIGNVRRKRVLTYRTFDKACIERDNKRARGHNKAFVFKIQIDVNNIEIID
jgi:hypothetical protein